MTTACPPPLTLLRPLPGPTEESNWVIHPRLLVGAYPSSVHDATNTAILSSILRLGVTTFVCLQLEYQHEGVTEAQWRGGSALRPYIFDAIALVDSLPASFFPADRGKPLGLEFVHFPIQGACLTQPTLGGGGSAQCALRVLHWGGCSSPPCALSALNTHTAPSDRKSVG